jgi:RNA-directed DNA polymerase
MRYSDSPELQALRARIQASTKDALVLEEMRRLGFWPKDQPAPDASDAKSEAGRLIAREGELVGELQQLGHDLQRLRDPEVALREMRKERMAAARARREETKRRQAEARYQQALAWHERRKHGIAWLGEGVSAGLADERSDPARLSARSLPVIANAAALAEAMGIPLAELRFLAYQRAVSRISHYRRFALPKKSGGMRLISAPMPRLKRAQYWVLDKLLVTQPLHAAAHGFVPGKSIVDNARAHAGQAVVINFDLKDFFPSIHYPRVKGLFASFGYSDSIATLLALICTEPPSETVEIDGQHYHVQTGPRCLPQGAPTSPTITNLLCRRLDRRLEASAAKLGFVYTRYADDMTFSAPAEAQGNLGRMIWCARQIITDEGFTLHPDKQRVMHAGRRQEVTGLVVNARPGVPRDKLRRFRATLFQVERDGPEGKSWHGNRDVIAALEGYARFIYMVDADKGAPLLARIATLKSRWANVAQARQHTTPLTRSAFRRAAAAGKAPREHWWIPVERPMPEREKTAQQLAQDKAAQRTAQRTSAQNPATPAVEEVAAYSAATPSTEAGDAPSLSTGAGLQIVLQALLLMLVALSSKNALLVVASIGWFIYSIRTRKVRWGGFLLLYFVCRIVWRHL